MSENAQTKTVACARAFCVVVVVVVAVVVVVVSISIYISDKKRRFILLFSLRRRSAQGSKNQNIAKEKRLQEHVCVQARICMCMWVCAGASSQRAHAQLKVSFEVK